MRIIPTPEQMVAGCAGLLIIASLAWWWLLSLPTAPHDLPSWKGDAVVMQRAIAPQIGDFARDYNVNDEDPFVPFVQRDFQDRTLKREHGLPRQPNHGHNPIVIHRPPKPPPLTWTKPSFASAGVPVCVGEIACDAGQIVMVHMPGGTAIWRLNVGDKVPPDGDTSAQWTLEAVIDNSLARFKDPSGEDQDLPIGGPLPDPPPPSADDAPAPQHKAQGGGAMNGQDQQQGGGGGANQPAGQKPRRPRRGLPPGMAIPGQSK